MWLLSFVPDTLIQWVVNLVLISGLVGVVITTLFKFFIKYFPWLIPYRTLLQIISLLLLVAGVYFKGGIGVEMEWRERVRIAEEKVKIAEEKAKQKNVEIQKVYVDRVKVVKEQEVVVQEKIKEVEKIIDAECKINKDVLDIHNEAAKNPGAKK